MYIVVVFFFSWLPYIIISRATYIYHFYLSVPLLCLAITYFINKYWNTRIGKAAAIALFASVVILFIVFYPVISGMPVPPTYIHKLKWFQAGSSLHDPKNARQNAVVVSVVLPAYNEADKLGAPWQKISQTLTEARKLLRNHHR